MPTGYTAGIIDGKIKTFPEFAKLCMRAFGATIHMRDDDMDAEYTPRTPSDYHQKEIESSNRKLTEARELSDDQIVAKRKHELEESKSYYINSIEKTNASKKILQKILSEVENYNPPTSDHKGIKDFMTQQLTETIRFDGDPKYAQERLNEITQELKSLNPAVIRSQIIAEAEKNLSYHIKEQEAEVKRCNQSNQWVTYFIASLPNSQTTVEK